MAGHWVKVEGGWQRQRGVWMTLEITSITFVPTAPPEAPVEEVANNPPDNNSFFVPGHHEYVETSYVWKPGKWVPNYSNWVWIPAHWVWTPCGYVFVPGYWDFLIELRGLLYAPVCVDLAYVKPGWTYTPCCVVHNNCLLEALFVRPGCGYFFGSYFQNKAYTCWPDHCVRGKICDPLFTHYKLHNKSKSNWEGNLKSLYSGRQSGRIASPPSNLKEFGKFVQDFKNKSIGASQVRQNLLIGSAKKINTNFVRMQKLDNVGVQSQKRFSDQLRNAGKDLAFKQTQHLQSNRRGGPNGGTNVLKLDMDKSINNHFRNFNSGRNGNNNNNKNGQSRANNLGKVLGGLQGGGLSNRNNNGQNNGQNNNGPSGSNKNGNGAGGNNGARILQGNGNGGLTPKFNQGGNSGNGGNGGNNTIRRFEGSSNGNTFRNLQGNGNGSSGGNSNGNSVIRRFEGSSSGNSFRSFQGNGNSGFQNSGNSGSSGFSSKSFQGSSGGSSFRSIGGSSGSGGSSSRSFGGGGGGNGGGRGRR
jgi:hypothetical protein